MTVAAVSSKKRKKYKSEKFMLKMVALPDDDHTGKLCKYFALKNSVHIIIKKPTNTFQTICTGISIPCCTQKYIANKT